MQLFRGALIKIFHSSTGQCFRENFPNILRIYFFPEYLQRRVQYPVKHLSILASNCFCKIFHHRCLKGSECTFNFRADVSRTIFNTKFYKNIVHFNQKRNRYDSQSYFNRSKIIFSLRFTVIPLFKQIIAGYFNLRLKM